MARPELADRVVEAYGGAERWRAAEEIHATVTLGGLLFKVKGRGKVPPAHARYTVAVHEPRTRIDPIDTAGHVGVLEGHDVDLEDADGNVVERRPDARSYFPFKGRRALRWDTLDLTYFLGYAFWNYLALPALLLRDDITWTQEGADTLRPSFPPELPTHGADEHIHVDPATGLVERFEYNPEIVTPQRFIKAANLVDEHRTTPDGIPYAAKRTVLVRDPVGKGLWKHPVLVAIDIEDFALR